MSLQLYKEQYQMLEKIAAEMHNANMKQASYNMGGFGVGVDPSNLPPSLSVDPSDLLPSLEKYPSNVLPPLVVAASPAAQAAQAAASPAARAAQAAASPAAQAAVASPAAKQEAAWHAAITDPIRRAAGWVDDHAQSLGGLTGAEAPWLKRTIGYGAPALLAGGLGAGAYALASRSQDDGQQESLASADLYNTIRQLQAENAEFRAYFHKQASAPPPRTIDDLSVEQKREFFQKHASPDQQNQMFIDEVVKTAAAMLTVNGLDNGSNPFDPIAVREAAVELLRSKGYKV